MHAMRKRRESEYSSSKAAGWSERVRAMLTALILSDDEAADSRHAARRERA